MGRVIPGPLLAEMQSAAPRLAFGILIERVDGTQYALTGADIDAEITGIPLDGVATGAIDYLSTPGLAVSNIRSTEGFDVDNLDGMLVDSGLVTHADVVRGLLFGAAWSLFLYCWADVSMGFFVVKVGHIGNVKPLTGVFVVELRDLRQYLQSEQADVLAKDCHYDYGDARCGKNKAASTVTGTVTSAADEQTFTDTARTEADDWFGNGEFEWTGGPNTGVRTKVKTYDGATKTFTLAIPMAAAIGAGDTYEAVAGCRKRRTEDCGPDKHDNVLNFGGAPDKPIVNEIVAGEPEE
jgi:uncharacterized phage protein (TIGR02218 family)